MKPMKRSNEPIFWSLFGAGGVVASLVAPALVFITGLALPLGLLGPDALSYERMLALVSSLPGALFLFVVISLLLWHTMHRINHSLHDIGIKAGLGGKVIFYGLALVGTMAAAYFLFATPL
ncbi:MAG: fumarate reductase subunit FrdD [Woeseiaceae bacterium]|nr:fumarate reductase subunit FrdD [Woeseiaceae bacterium]